MSMELSGLGVRVTGGVVSSSVRTLARDGGSLEVSCMSNPRKSPFLVKVWISLSAQAKRRLRALHGAGHGGRWGSSLLRPLLGDEQLLTALPRIEGADH